jgi:GMP synthase (glutamine-hydrolysing)
LLASSDTDLHQVFSLGASVWGVQFHPEMNAEITRHYIMKQSRELEEKGFKPSDLLEKTIDTPFGRMILKRFIQIVEESI